MRWNQALESLKSKFLSQKFLQSGLAWREPGVLLMRPGGVDCYIGFNCSRKYREIYCGIGYSENNAAKHGDKFLAEHYSEKFVRLNYMNSVPAILFSIETDFPSFVNGNGGSVFEDEREIEKFVLEVIAYFARIKSAEQLLNFLLREDGCFSWGVSGVSRRLAHCAAMAKAIDKFDEYFGEISEIGLKNRVDDVFFERDIEGFLSKLHSFFSNSGSGLKS